MEKIFDTNKSLNHFKKKLPLCTMIIALTGLYPWYRYGNIRAILQMALTGCGISILCYYYMWLKYGNISYEITDKGIAKKKYDRIIKTVTLDEVEYYFFKKPERILRIKVRNGNDFIIAMTGPTEEIVSTLQSLGIKEKA
jgi:hypothetical protein